MADFCKQCSVAVFGKDFGDLANLGGEDPKPLEPGMGYAALCEGCGAAIVLEDGTCIAEDCMEQHGKQ